MSPKQSPQDQSDSKPLTVTSGEEIELARKWVQLQREWSELQMDLEERRVGLTERRIAQSG